MGYSINIHTHIVIILIPFPVKPELFITVEIKIGPIKALNLPSWSPPENKVLVATAISSNVIDFIVNNSTFFGMID